MNFKISFLVAALVLAGGVFAQTPGTAAPDKKKPAVKTGKALKTSVPAEKKPAVKTGKALKTSVPIRKNSSTKKNSYSRKGLIPISSRGEKSGSGIGFGEDFEYCLYARKGQKIPVTFINSPIHKFAAPPVDIILSTPTKPNAEKKIIPHKGRLNYLLHAKETGIYSFRLRARKPSQKIHIESPVPGQVFPCEEKLCLLNSSGTLYFSVPAGVKKVVAEGSGTPGKESSVELLRPDGTIAASRKTADKFLLSAVRNDASGYEIWAIRFNASQLYLRLSGPLPRFFAASPANLLVKKGTEKKYNPYSLPLFRLKDIVRNGDFRSLDKIDRRYKITTKEFPRFWGGHSAALATTEDNRNHIDFSNLLWHNLSLPSSGGKFKGEITLSGSGNVKCFLRTTTGKAPHKDRKPVFGPFPLTDRAKTFTFLFETAPGESGYIYIQADPESKTRARLSSLRILPVLNNH